MRDYLRKALYSSVFGACMGDALGVPVEFRDRKYLDNNPITAFIGHGTYNQPKGTWSDDSSLMFCKMDAIINTGFGLSEITDEAIWTLCAKIAGNFADWYSKGLYAANGVVFDVGIATQRAVEKIMQGVKTWQFTDDDERNNGNGSLMRILPLAFILPREDMTMRFKVIRAVSSITHGHIRSVIACHIYIEFAAAIIRNIGMDIMSVFEEVQTAIKEFYRPSEYSGELQYFDRVLRNVKALNRNNVKSDGYVVHTLEAAVHSLMVTKSTREAVLYAVNLGSDTDTTAVVAGGLAGLFYRDYEDFKEDCMSNLVDYDMIEDLVELFETSVFLNSDIES